MIKSQEEHVDMKGTKFGKVKSLMSRYANCMVLTCLCLTGMCSAMLAIGFLGITIPEIERQYRLPSTTSGLISAVLDISFCAVAFLVGLQVSLATEKRWKQLELQYIALGTLLMALGAVLFITPVVFYRSASPTSKNVLLNHFELPANTTCSVLFNTFATVNENKHTRNVAVLGIFYAAFAIIGAGSAPIFTLAPVIMKKLTSSQHRSVWLAWFYFSSLAGPAIAYILGKVFLSKPLYLEEVVSNNKETFVGAWWLSYLFGSILTLVIGLLTCTVVYVFSRKGSLTERTFSEDDDETKPLLEEEEEKFGFCKSLWALSKNRLYVLMCISSSITQLLITGFSTFMPKFVENIYDVDPANSGLSVGLMVIPGACAGSILGGYIIKRFNMTLKQICGMAVILSLLCAVLLVPAFLVNCDRNEKVVYTLKNGTAGCENCANEKNMFSICDEHTKTTYISPCYAGCGDKYAYDNATNLITFAECSVSQGNVFSVGKCSKRCKNIYLFGTLFFLINFMLFANYVPVTELTIRCVEARKLALAIGMQQLLQRLVGHVPGPVLIGKMIDQACLLWSENSFDYANSGCVYYSFRNYRLNLLFISLPLMVVNTAVMYVAYRMK